MKFTVKGIFLTLGIILLGFLFLIAPTYVMGMAKNYVIAYENKKRPKRKTIGYMMPKEDGLYIMTALLTGRKARKSTASLIILILQDM